jgi:hypothetical protein
MPACYPILPWFLVGGILETIRKIGFVTVCIGRENIYGKGMESWVVWDVADAVPPASLRLPARLRPLIC